MTPVILPVILVSILPGALWLLYFYRQDRYEPEPRSLVFWVFLGGMLLVIPAGALESFGKEGLVAARNAGDLISLFYYSFFFIGLIEEGLKFLLLWFLVRPKKVMDEPVDGVVYGITAGLGFASLENFLYTQNLGLEVGIWRGIVACLAHAAFTGWGGYFLSAEGTAARAETRFALGWGVALSLHGLYNFLLFVEHPALTLAAFTMTGVLIYTLLLKMRQLVKAPLR
ncbi:MAG: PrsW family intramembrane metalloprotease [Firmicutes bacterium]|jgi:RsiW-degrading membrane proteinase PrsW (M82 family)|nr:PrsW family intramembrane metalloprotease [Bacillota bacterium]